jgi:hypothetical protein
MSGDQVLWSYRSELPKPNAPPGKDDGQPGIDDKSPADRDAVVVGESVPKDEAPAKAPEDGSGGPRDPDGEGTKRKPEPPRSAGQQRKFGEFLSNGDQGPFVIASSPRIGAEYFDDGALEGLVAALRRSPLIVLECVCADVSRDAITHADRRAGHARPLVHVGEREWDKRESNGLVRLEMLHLANPLPGKSRSITGPAAIVVDPPLQGERLPHFIKDVLNGDYAGTLGDEASLALTTLGKESRTVVVVLELWGVERHNAPPERIALDWLLPRLRQIFGPEVAATEVMKIRDALRDAARESELARKLVGASPEEARSLIDEIIDTSSAASTRYIDCYFDMQAKPAVAAAALMGIFFTEGASRLPAPRFREAISVILEGRPPPHFTKPEDRRPSPLETWQADPDAVLAEARLRVRDGNLELQLTQVGKADQIRAYRSAFYADCMERLARKLPEWASTWSLEPLGALCQVVVAEHRHVGMEIAPLIARGFVNALGRRPRGRDTNDIEAELAAFGQPMRSLDPDAREAAIEHVQSAETGGPNPALALLAFATPGDAAAQSAAILDWTSKHDVGAAAAGNVIRYLLAKNEPGLVLAEVFTRHQRDAGGKQGIWPAVIQCLNHIQFDYCAKETETASVAPLVNGERQTRLAVSLARLPVEHLDLLVHGMIELDDAAWPRSEFVGEEAYFPVSLSRGQRLVWLAALGCTDMEAAQVLFAIDIEDDTSDDEDDRLVGHLGGVALATVDWLISTPPNVSPIQARMIELSIKQRRKLRNVLNVLVLNLDAQIELLQRNASKLNFNARKRLHARRMHARGLVKLLAAGSVQNVTGRRHV